MQNIIELKNNLSEKPTCAIVLAGGLGTRLRSVVSEVPKPMAIVQNKPFLVHLLRYWKKQGIDQFILCVGYKSNLIIDYFGNEFEGSSINYSIEEVPLGTGGAVLEAAKKNQLKEPFILINVDTYFEVELSILHKFSIENNVDWCFSLFVSVDKVRYLPVGLSADGSLKFNTDSRYANGGVYWINPRVFHPLFELISPNLSLEKQVFSIAKNIGQSFRGVKFSGTFIDIGMPDDFYRAQFMSCFS